MVKGGVPMCGVAIELHDDVACNNNKPRKTNRWENIVLLESKLISKVFFSMSTTINLTERVENYEIENKLFVRTDLFTQ